MLFNLEEISKTVLTLKNAHPWSAGNLNIISRHSYANKSEESIFDNGLLTHSQINV